MPEEAVQAAEQSEEQEEDEQQDDAMGEEEDEMDEEEQLRVMADTAWADVEHEFSMLSNDVALELGGSQKTGGTQELMVTLAVVVDVLGILEGVIETGLIMTLVNWVLYIATPMTYVMKIAKMKQMVMKMSPERASRRFGKLIGCSWSRFIGYCMWRIVELVPLAQMFPSWTKTTWQERRTEQQKKLQLKALQKDLDDFGVKLKDAASKKQDNPLVNMQTAYTLREEVKALDGRYMGIC